MDTMDDGAQADTRPGNQGKHPRPGQSGEGARSALELLIQQQERREARRLLEEAGPRRRTPRPEPQRACRRKRRTLSGS
jgi:hypothetical protein